MHEKTTMLLSGDFGAQEIQTHAEILAAFEKRENKPNLRHGPLRKAPPIYVGETYTPADVERHPNGSPLGRRVKASRRMLRKRIRERISSSGRAIVKARHVRLESERLATNSHEAKRYVEMAADERHTVKTWWQTFLSCWYHIGGSYASLLKFARAK